MDREFIKIGGQYIERGIRVKPDTVTDAEWAAYFIQCMEGRPIPTIFERATIEPIPEPIEPRRIPQRYRIGARRYRDLPHLWADRALMARAAA